LDEASKEAVFYQLAQRYVWLGTKKEKMDLLSEIESIVLPNLNIKPMHRKSLIRKLRFAVVAEVVNHKRGRKPKFNDIEKRHLVLVWKLTGHPCSKRLVAIMDDWLQFYSCSEDIKQLIRLRDPSIKYTEVGYIESDTVLHCGNYIWGMFAHTVSATDLLSGWTCGLGIRYTW
jgi:hypothetical protein